MGSATNLEDIAVGYNNEDCLKIDSGIEEVYSASITSIQNHFKSDLVDNVASEWYSEAAVSYFTKWQALCANTSDDLRIVFQNFRDQIQENINSWRTRTGSSGIDLQNITEKTISIDISSVKTVDDSGNRYISNTIEDNISEWINTCRANIGTDIANTVAEKTVGGFIGESQNAAINNAMSGLAGIIDKILCFLNTGDNSLYNAISEYRKKYTQTGNDVSETTTNNDYTEGVDIDGINSSYATSSNAGGSGSGNPGISSSNPGIGSGNPAAVKTPKFSDSMGNDLADENINANTPNNQKVAINFASKKSDDDINKTREQEKQRLRDLGIDPTDMELHQFFYDPKTGKVLSPTEALQREKELYNNSPDFIKLIKRCGTQIALGNMDNLEPIIDTLLGAYVLATGSEFAAKFVSQDLTGGLQNVFDDVYTTYDGEKYHNPHYKLEGEIDEMITRGIVKNYWYSVFQLYAASAGMEKLGYKTIKTVYAGLSNIGSSIDKDVGIALENGGDLRTATLTGMAAGGAKQAIASSFDVVGDKTIAKYIPDKTKAKKTHDIAHAAFSIVSATGQEGVERLETDMVHGEQESIPKSIFVDVLLKKGAKTFLYDTFELESDKDSINNIENFKSTAIENMITNAAINQLAGEAKIVDVSKLYYDNTIKPGFYNAQIIARFIIEELKK